MRGTVVSCSTADERSHERRPFSIPNCIRELVALTAWEERMDVDAGIIDQRVKALVDRRKADLVSRLGPASRNDEHKQKSAAFTVLCTQAMLSLDEDSALDALMDGSGDGGVDAIHIGDVTDNEFCVTILQSKYAKSLEGSGGFPANSIVRIISTIGQMFDPYNKRIWKRKLEEQIAEIRSLILDGNAPEIRILLCNNGKAWEPDGQAEIDASGLGSRRVSFAHVNHHSLVQLLQKRKSVDCKLRLIGKAVVEDFDHRRVLVGRIPVSEIRSLFDTQGDTLLERNIRRYLGLKDNRVNAGIHQTLVDPATRGNFYFFNNGITGICSKFSHNAHQHEHWDVSVRGLQVVNGGQTCKTIQRALEQHPDEDYSTTSVLLRLYELSSDDDSLVGSVTFATNSQNPVDLTDLRSNDSVQERLATGMRDLGFEYKRKRDEQAPSGPEVITSAVAAEATMAVWRRKPHAAKFRQSKLFGDFYSDVFTDDLQPAHVILSVLIFRMIESERKRPKQKRPRFVPYASHFLAMVCGDLLMEKAEIRREDVSHDNLAKVREIFESKRADLYKRSVQEVESALSELGIKDGTALPRIAAQFRRGDLLEPLESAFTRVTAGGAARPMRRKSRSSERTRSEPTEQKEVKPRKRASVQSSTSSLNEKEKTVMSAFSAAKEMTIDELAERAFPRESRGNSWVRNSLRKLRTMGVVSRVSSGTYRISDST